MYQKRMISINHRAQRNENTYAPINQHRLPIDEPIRDQEQHEAAHIPIGPPERLLAARQRRLGRRHLEGDDRAVRVRRVHLAERVGRGGGAHGGDEQACEGLVDWNLGRGGGEGRTGRDAVDADAEREELVRERGGRHAYC